LSSKAPIAHIDVRTLAHATEEADKVEAALLNTIPSGLVGTVTIKKSNLTGHHGNPILLFETRIKEKGAVKEAFRKLSSGLSMMDKELLASEIRQHLERGNLYLRLDKQSAYLNEIRLGKVDPVHFKIHFKKHDTEEVVETCREFGLIP
jgi:RNA binding exosome subunit